MGLVARLDPTSGPVAGSVFGRGRGRGPEHEGTRRRTAASIAVHAVLGGVGAAGAAAAGHSPVSRPAWFSADASGTGALLLALAVGAGAGGAMVWLSRWLVGHTGWARDLARDLGEPVRHASSLELVGLAAASSLGEELFFRGLLAQTLGLVLSSLAFGALHRAAGPARLAYVAWASIAGLVFGAAFAATGSLLAAVVAHGVVNASNLWWLREAARNAPPLGPAPALGGLLARRHGAREVGPLLERTARGPRQRP